MYLFRRRPRPSVVSLLDADGRPCDLRMKFRQGIIHIDAGRMEKGKYRIRINQGKKVDLRQFVVA
ncbi:MAG: hypothetical protein KTR24_05975 [Saprospiraceae bacterium]|nr:hypothetical protein [Saprospiraceae bacterium]